MENQNKEGEIKLSLAEKLSAIQFELKAPKGSKHAQFGYNYRNIEDIQEAVKPLLDKYGCTIIFSDSIMTLEGEFFAATVRDKPNVNMTGVLLINSTATIMDGTNEISVSAQAGIEPLKKGSHIAQNFGASSSYARKYAAGGLLLLDDTKDPDGQPATEAPRKPAKQAKQAKPAKPTKPTISKIALEKLKAKIIEGETDVLKQAEAAFTLKPEQKQELEALQIQVDAGR